MKKRSIIMAVLLLIVTLTGSLFLLSHQYAGIDQWSAAITEDGIAIAEAASGYGVAARRYVIPPEEYSELVSLLRTVTESNSSRKAPKNLQRIDCRLVFHYEDKLWLFHCYENNILGLMFNDPQTGAYYGCEGSLLYIKSPELWRYIVDTVNKKAE